MLKTRILLFAVVAFLISTSWVSLRHEKQISDARVACGQYVARQLGPSSSLEAPSQWPAAQRPNDTWLVQVNYALHGRYDAMWCHLRSLGSQYDLARMDTHYEDSRRGP
jgi:hypothetical protein